MRAARARGPRTRAAIGTVGVALIVAILSVPTGPFGRTPPADRPVVDGAGSGTADRTLSDPAAVPPPLPPPRSAPLPDPGVAPARVHLAPLHLPGPHPKAWGPSSVPPGAPWPSGARLPRSGALGSGLNQSWNNSDCAGLWPDGWGDADSQSKYVSGCYGHDEPGIEFYSDLPGSGGNVSWNVTLPTDRTPSQQQGDLYVAIWFGLTLADPYSWLHQCFLELQFYPDQSWTSSFANNNWIAAAVAWQIEAVNGYENPCVYSPLYLDGTNGAAFLNLQGGDALTVRMTGWAGDPAGEQVLVADLTSGARSTLDLYNTTAGLPLDPAYSTNAFENGLQWTPGGEFPVVFAFEVGHATSSSVPENNSYGGCSPGVPPPTAQDGAVPCPSYDSASWANDTRSPWRIAPPTFFNATVRSTPAQVAFGQDFGGLGLVDSISNGSCIGRDGSAWCTYPWYSYSCALAAFEFGATDYPGTTEDFGQYLEYGARAQQNGLGLGFYPPSNYSIPTCQGPSYSVDVGVSGGGQVHFLAPSSPAGGRFGAIGPGNYSISADGPRSVGFTGWRTTGSVVVTTPPDDPWANLWVRGNGSVEATFGPNPPTTRVAYSVPIGPATGGAVVTDGFLFEGGVPVAHLANGGTADLMAGTYGIEAYPPPGWRFGAWTAGPGLLVAAPDLPYTWLIVTGTSNSSALNASYVSEAGNASVEFWASGSAGGSVSFDGVVTQGVSTRTVAVGSYPIRATASAGAVFAGWYAYGDAELSDQSANSTVTVEGSSPYVEAVFEDRLNLSVSPVGGAIAIVGVGRFTNGSSVDLGPGQYTVASEPGAGWVFSAWQAPDPAALWVGSPTLPDTSITVNASATLDLVLASASSARLRLGISPAGAGTLAVGGVAGLANGTLDPDASVGGTYPIEADPAPGYTFGAWSTGGGATITSTLAGTAVALSTANGTLTATFAPLLVPVSFVAAGLPSAIGSINGTRLGTDATVALRPGRYPISIDLTGAVATFDGWTVTSNLTVSGSNLTVAGPGTLTARIAPFGLGPVTVAPATVRWNATATFRVSTNGSGPFAYEWAGLPGCPSQEVAVLGCRATEAGRFPVTVTVVDPEGDAASAGPANLTVDDPSLTVSASASPNATDVGVASEISVTPLDGLAPYTYRYAGLPAGCAGQNLSTFSCLPSQPSNGSWVNVTDALGLGAVVPVPLVVHPRPALALTAAGPWTVDAGRTTDLAVAPTDGTGPYRFVWSGLPGACPAVDAPSVTCRGLSTGAYPVTVELTDALGVTATVAHTLEVVPAPSVGPLTAEPNATDVGRPIALSVGVTGGVAPFTFAFGGLPPGCASVNASTLECRPTAPLATFATVTVSDRDGLTSTASASVVVAPAPFLRSVTVRPGAPTAGQPMTIDATVGGGTSPWSFGFAGLPPGCAPSAAPRLTCTPARAGTFVVNVSVTDVVGARANASLTLTIAPAPGSAGSDLALELEVGIGLGAAVAAALGAWGWRRRRPPPPEGRAAEPGSDRAAGEGPDGPPGLPAGGAGPGRR